MFLQFLVVQLKMFFSVQPSPMDSSSDLPMVRTLNDENIALDAALEAEHEYLLICLLNPALS